MMTMIQIDDDQSHIARAQKSCFTFFPSTRQNWIFDNLAKKSIIIKNDGERISIYTIFTSGDLALPQAMWPFQLQEEQKGSIRNVSTVSPLVCETFTIKKIIKPFIIKSQKLYSGCQGRLTKKWQFHFLRTLLRKSAQTAKRTILPWNGIDHIWDAQLSTSRHWRILLYLFEIQREPRKIYPQFPTIESPRFSIIKKRRLLILCHKKNIIDSLYIIRERRTNQVNTRVSHNTHFF